MISMRLFRRMNIAILVGIVLAMCVAASAAQVSEGIIAYARPDVDISMVGGEKFWEGVKGRRGSHVTIVDQGPEVINLDQFKGLCKIDPESISLDGKLKEGDVLFACKVDSVATASQNADHYLLKSMRDNRYYHVFTGENAFLNYVVLDWQFNKDKAWEIVKNNSFIGHVIPIKKTQGVYDKIKKMYPDSIVSELDDYGEEIVRCQNGTEYAMFNFIAYDGYCRLWQYCIKVGDGFYLSRQRLLVEYSEAIVLHSVMNSRYGGNDRLNDYDRKLLMKDVLKPLFKRFQDNIKQILGEHGIDIKTNPDTISPTYWPAEVNSHSITGNPGVKFRTEFKLSDSKLSGEIVSFKVPEDRSESIEFKMKLSVDGSDPVRFYGDDIDVDIQGCAFGLVAHVVHPELHLNKRLYEVRGNAPLILTIQLYDRNTQKPIQWNMLKPGKYKMSTGVGLGKVTHAYFHYQSTGCRLNEIVFEIK